MKLNVKTIFKIIIFAFIFAAVFYVITTTLRFKDDVGIHQMQDFYRYGDNAFDVISIGSSRVGVNVDPEILLQEYGISEYNLWATTQPAWNSYYYLKEAFKIQTPELICVEATIMTHEAEYSDYARIISNTMGMKWSKDKIEAIKVSADEEIQKAVFLEWPTYHARYLDLKEEDFQRYFWNYQYGNRRLDSGYNSVVNQAPVVLNDDTSIPLYEKQEKYLRKIIELCKEEKVPLLIFVTPYNASESDQQKFNRIQEIVGEYGEGVTFKNFIKNIEQIPVVFEKDYADDSGHFNNYGIEKFTMYFGRYLKENYNITVRNEEYKDKFNLQKLYSCAYRLRDPFLGDGVRNYIDTGQKLYDDPNRNWTVLADFATDINSTDQVYFACFAEETDAYRGLLVKREGDTLYIVVGNTYYIDAKIPEEGYARLVITKNGTLYTVYLNGEKIAENVGSSCGKYGGSLVIGGELNEQQMPFRYSAATIYEMEVYNEVISENNIINWYNMEREAADEFTSQIQESVAYVMEEEFIGDGKEVYVDTGIHLYDDPMRNWTLLTELDLTCDKNSRDLVFLSNFSEETDQYRGLLVRYVTDEIQIILGNTYYVVVPDSGNDSMKIGISKEGDTYTVYVDGEVFAEDISSYCAPYFGNLMVGCEEIDQTPFRISPVTVKQLEIHDGILPEGDIIKW